MIEQDLERMGGEIICVTGGIRTRCKKFFERKVFENQNQNIIGRLKSESFECDDIIDQACKTISLIV
jgi:hypothetical protein